MGRTIPSESDKHLFSALPVLLRLTHSSQPVYEQAIRALQVERPTINIHSALLDFIELAFGMEGVTILAPRSGISPKSCKKRRFQASNDSPTLPQMMAFAINTSGQLASQFTVAQGKPRSLCTRLLRHRQAIPDGLCYRRSRHQRIIFPLACQSHPSNSRTTTEPQDDEQHKEKSPFASFKTVRKVLAALSVLGVAETTYLTFIKLFSSPGAICSTEGCLDVLTGPFSTFLGIPLTVFGMLAYASFAYLCIWPLIAEDEEVLTENESQPAKFIPANEVYAARDAATRPLMLALSTASFVFTVYLMGLLVFVIHSMCPYCVFSAILSGLIFVITAFVGRAVPKIRSALIIGSASTAAAGVAAAAMFFLSLPAQILAQPPSEPQSPPQITMRSNSDTMVSAK